VIRAVLPHHPASLFPIRTGERLTRVQVYEIPQRIAAQGLADALDELT
jgi:hypothetical protein